MVVVTPKHYFNAYQTVVVVPVVPFPFELVKFFFQPKENLAVALKNVTLKVPEPSLQFLNLLPKFFVVQCTAPPRSSHHTALRAFT